MSSPLLSREEQSFLRRSIWKRFSFEPHDRQLAALDSMAAMMVMACGKKAGKTTTLIHKCLEVALSPHPYGTDELFIACISISYDQCRLTFNPVVRKLRLAGIQFEVDHARTDPAEVVFTNDFGVHVRIKCYSTKEPEILLGAKWDLVLIDEGAYMSEDIWTGYLAVNTRRACIATSPYGKNWVYKFYLQGKDNTIDDPNFFAQNFDTFANIKMPGYSPDGNHSGDYAKMLMEAEWCKKNAPYTYAQDFLGQFIEGGDNYFRNYDNNIDNTLVASSTGIIAPPQRGFYYSTGVDLARYRDNTVIVVLDQYRNLCFFRKLPHQDWILQRKEIATVARTYPGVCWVDASGVGQPVFESLESDEGVSAEPFVFNNNSRLELLTELRISLSTEKGMRLAPLPELLAALSDVVIQRSEAGRDIIGDARGHLPDEVVALALANWGLRDFPRGKALAHHSDVYTGGFQPELDKFGRPIYKEENGVEVLKRPGVDEPYILYKRPMEIIRNGYSR